MKTRSLRLRRCVPRILLKDVLLVVMVVDAAVVVVMVAVGVTIPILGASRALKVVLLIFSLSEPRSTVSLREA
jgi:hypothetical protein